MTGTVRVVRRKTFQRDPFIRYTVFLDGRRAAHLWNGKRASIQLGTGDHRILVTCPGGRSPEATFALNDDKSAVFECGPNGSLGSVPAQLLEKKPWLDLHQVSP